MSQKKYFTLATLGCRTNQYETQGYRDQLLQLGCQEATQNDLADLIIVNTCTVTESADSNSRHIIRSLVKKHPGAKVVVTGCLAERRPDLIQKIEGVDLVVPNQEKEKLMVKLFPNLENLPEFSISHFEAHTRSFVKVQDGCNSFCTYCIIPYVRGRSRSRSITEIISEVNQLVSNGYKEVVITGINVGDFEEKGKRLADLIRAVDQVKGLKRLRVSSIDPDEVDDDLADAILNGRVTCPSMHIVLQAGSNVVLKRMNRKYTRQIFLSTCRRLKKASPDFTFTTDVIVGFPGETMEDFNETLDVMAQIKFAKVHMFPYSRRDRTRAAVYKNCVSDQEIARRKQILLRLAEQQTFALQESYVGRTLSILTESIDENGMIGGHTENFLYVKVPKGNLKINEIVSVKLKQNTSTGLVGEIDE